MALTIARFASTPELVAASENNPPLKQGASGEAVAIVQQAFIDLGFPMPKSTQGETRLPDGIFGTETTATARSFQQAKGLTVDGIVGRQTLAALEAAILVLFNQQATRILADLRQTDPRA
jgi:peptidoglycan hydrolase-like protein with peptidoglycan-binding domain